ncbi:PAS domain-containing protein [Halobacterium yunchengense]|uniref:PAS domain-containing protein n=1 Tax=Halobacterium yunchengense TaxID=3108497 RepID=UPI003009E79D
MGDSRTEADAEVRVLFVSDRLRRRAAVERAFPECAPLSVTTAASAEAVEALSEADADCVGVEHALGPDEARRTDESGAVGDGGSAGSDALRVLERVRDADPAVPAVVLEAEGAASVASDAISLDVTEYVRASETADALAAVAGACHDAAATYRSRQDVAMVNDLARSVYERVTDGFFALDRDWRFTYLNDAAAEVLEVDPEDVRGETVWDAFPAASDTDFGAEYRRAMASQTPVTFREHYSPLGKTFEVRAFPAEDGLSVHFREVIDGDESTRSDHLLELTDLLSSDLLDSIEAVEADLEAARERVDADELDAALDGVEHMRSLVNSSIRLASAPPRPDAPGGE